MSERMLGEIARLREELAKVRAKSEERRVLLERHAFSHPRFLIGSPEECNECPSIIVGHHAEDCEIAAALKDE